MLFSVIALVYGAGGRTGFFAGGEVLITRPKVDWAGGIPPMEMVYSCVVEHARGLARLKRLKDYYDGRHEICKRTRMSGLPNNALVHGFPRYICTMTSGYLIGAPIGYACEEQESGVKAMREAFARCSMDSVDAEIAMDAAIFGKGVELIYAGEDGLPRSAAVRPMEAFVVYSGSVDVTPMFGVRCIETMKADGEADGWMVEVYTDEMVIVYSMKEISLKGFTTPKSVKRHFFGGVPMVEYWNGKDEKGDFEGAISLIDAYDLLESDRLNDKQQFVDALLVLYGCTLETDEMGRTPGRQLREDKAIALPDGDARAEWLCKQLNEADTEVLKSALNGDIHKMCMVPDMTDVNFAGNSSGVAMRYKLLGLEQLTHIKERWFREALRERIRLYAAYLELMGMPEVDAEKVRIQFTRSLPVNELEVAQTAGYLRGLIEDDELRKHVSAAIGL